MSVLKPKFNDESLNHPVLSLLWIFWAVSIDNDRQQREKEQKQKIRNIQKRQAQSEIKKIQPAFRP